ncbi:MAG: isoprenyl transferase [Gammaproteobacteria bacterium]|nr:MAG: isoprenyl transferase [Gammaproteobacteria bacterium]
MAAPLKHLAIIMDGNGRWARRRGQARSAGHRAGVEAVRRVVSACPRFGIRHLTLFAFSSENWRRPAPEVRFLQELFAGALGRELDKLVEQGVRLRFAGDLARFEPRLRRMIETAEQVSAGNDVLFLNIAVNYGGRWDLARGARRLAEKVARGELDPAAIDEAALAGELALAGQPDPDLLIRTGGESRISNFLIWQLAYAELYFCDCLWPDFDENALAAALEWYAGRQRRFGRTPEQVAAQGGEHA